MEKLGFPAGLDNKVSACSAGDTGDSSSIPGSGRYTGGENYSLLQYSYLENSMERGAWQATVQSIGLYRVGCNGNNLACMHDLSIGDKEIVSRKKGNEIE